LIVVCCCHFCNRNKKAFNSNRPRSYTGPYVQSTLKATSSLPHQQASLSSTSLSNKPAGNAFSSHHSIIAYNAGEEPTPPPAIYHPPPNE
jgi:hypothetical protein